MLPVLFHTGDDEGLLGLVLDLLASPAAQLFRLLSDQREVDTGVCETGAASLRTVEGSTAGCFWLV